MPFFVHDGLRLQYFETGEGPPVLLIHGWGGRARRQWHATVTELRSSYRFFGLSLRGHGQSEEMGDPEYSLSDLAADCDALRVITGIDRWAVVGYSLGGIVALKYASLYPDRVKAVCAVSPMIVPLWLALVMRYLRLPVAYGLRLARALPPALSGKMLHNVAKTRLRTLFHTVDLMKQWEPRTTGIPASVPSVMILGDEDRSAHGERAIAAAPKMDVRMLENTGHFPLWRQRRRFVRELRDVLDSYAR
jgi:pimeloyl-ACP methyl ester carboxylesterase